MTFYANYTDPAFGPGEIHVEKYTSNGNICLLGKGVDGEPWRRFTTNLDKLGEYQIAINVNEGGADAYVGILQSAGIIKHPPEGGVKIAIQSGFCNYPVYNLTEDFRTWLSSQG